MKALQEMGKTSRKSSESSETLAGDGNQTAPIQQPTTYNDLDMMLANDMAKLNVQERELVYEEVHGVNKLIVETKDIIVEKLQEFADELEDIPNEDKSAFLKARQLCSNYTNDTKLRLMFLRAEHFKAKEAAKRFTLFFQGKLDTFGEDILSRPVYLSDLDKNDTEFLKSGFIQLLPVRDQSDRAVVVDMTVKRPYKTYTNVVSI